MSVYYRIYADDGAIPSKTPVSPGDPFLGRIKIKSVPPPRTAKAVKFSIGNVEGIKDRKSTSLFLTPFNQSPMGDAEKIVVPNLTGPGSIPQEPVALVAKMSDSERSALESDGRAGLGSATELTTPPEIRCGMSIQHSLSFFLHILTVEGSVLYALRRRL